ncbi:MAG: carbohydrate kinase family protein [Candidatus Scalindua sp. AMX11]|nr:MAG: carbohydrate kinase family protein [Candidatus Scalindua sp.]NOG84490.1 carbohydrate kinase family protein [Planctomycetota bacterium]RZV80501.1 MAG: carbohydrate kinase family protein [Candidatus Scalindua sp. SCAELEC01]TDE65279.1 MAG: carbohydrate kinase family protein [Candidatus Scalindua sp. AMX11]GJQ58491.1 MAG: carbohydrate kinase [Candidatus Scalindua sp.]
MNILVSGSLAYDRIMNFPGKFSDHILPEKVHILNVCFMIDGLRENFGGTAGNIAYALSLFGDKPTIIGTAGRDFEPYKNWLIGHKIPTEHIKIIEEELTAGAYITTDKSDNQITAFNPGAMKFSSVFDFEALTHKDTIALVAPGNLDDMYNFSNVYKRKKIDYIFDPGQSLPAWTSERLAEMIEDSKIFICNDYELQLTQEKTSFSIEDILERTEILIKTKGEFGSEIMLLENNKTKTIEIPVAKADPVNDPTGAGDAYRAGLIKGFMLSENDIIHGARMGSVCAAYCVEVHGPQNFHFTPESFNERFESVFGEKAF